MESNVLGRKRRDLPLSATPNSPTYKVVRVVVAVLAAELELALGAAGLGGALERLGGELASREELVGRADVDEHVERAGRRLGASQQVRRVVLEPLGGRRGARACVQVRGECADAPGDAGGVAER